MCGSALVRDTRHIRIMAAAYSDLDIEIKREKEIETKIKARERQQLIVDEQWW